MSFWKRLAESDLAFTLSGDKRRVSDLDTLYEASVFNARIARQDEDDAQAMECDLEALNYATSKEVILRKYRFKNEHDAGVHDNDDGDDPDPYPWRRR